MSRKFQIKAVPSSWLENNGRRLDCGPYMSGALEARELLRKHITEPLSKVTSEIYHAGRESRIWVDSPEHGVPFMGSTDILAMDLSCLPLISKKQIASNPKFSIGKGWTLITRSGTVGRMAFARSDMDGVACSEHVMPVVPNESSIKPGYLYAYLSRVRTRYFQRNKNRVCRGHGGVACVPCFIFPKASWSVSNRSFPVLTVLRVSMTDASSAASYTSSSTGFSGRMHLMSTARTKRCTIDSSGGADSVFSIKFSLSWPTKRLLMAH